MTKIKLAKYAQVLGVKDAELRQTISNGRKAITVVENGSDLADRTQFTGIQELAMKNLGADTVTLHQVQTARQRLNDGTFGICLDCKENISPKRLKAVPWAQRCVDCQEAADRQPTLSVATA